MEKRWQHAAKHRPRKIAKNSDNGYNAADFIRDKVKFARIIEPAIASNAKMKSQPLAKGSNNPVNGAANATAPVTPTYKPLQARGRTGGIHVPESAARRTPEEAVGGSPEKAAGGSPEEAAGRSLEIAAGDAP
ncbi:MAG: hypothetical protein LBQ12_07525 [Deltaproteobacteria bacterium]|nr:hypothetical protein [Deltaproteobacteria bacterium]